MGQEVTAVIEEYLEAVYRLQEKSGAARTNELVKMLNVAPGTVTNTVERLEKEGYITHVPYKGVKLTGKGNKIAVQVLRRHRLTERLLTDILHVEWDKVHDAACKLEHGMTEDIIPPLERALKHPKTCPHGNPIPTNHGDVIEDKSQALTELNEKEQGIVMKITDENPDLLRYVETLGIVPGISVEVVEKAPFDGPITVKIDGAVHALGQTVASVVKVKKTKTRKTR